MTDTNAEAIICGELYDVYLVSSPDENDLCIVDVPFDDGIERLAVIKGNVTPKTEETIDLMMGVIS